MRPPEERWQSVMQFADSIKEVLDYLVQRSDALTPTEKERFMGNIRDAHVRLENVVESEECEMP